jgi:hypothetical protein
MVTLPDATKERKYKRYFALALLALVLPSGWIFYRTVTEGIHSGQITEYLTEHVRYPGMEVVKQEIGYADGHPHVDLVLLGEHVPDALLSEWQSGLAGVVADATLKVVQNQPSDAGLDEMQRLVDLYSAGRSDLADRDAEIRRLNDELAATRSALDGELLPNSLPGEVLLQDPGILEVHAGMVAERRRSNESSERVPWVDIVWDVDSTPERMAAQIRIAEWLRLRLQREDVRVKHH